MQKISEEKLDSEVKKINFKKFLTVFELLIDRLKK